MIDIQKMRLDGDKAINSAPNDAGFAYACELRSMLGQALDELEATRRPVAGRFDVAAAREELARIDAAWDDPQQGYGGYLACYRAAKALLDRALAAIDAGWPEPVAITPEVVGNAAGIAYAAWDGEHIDMPHDFDDVARAVLEYAASLGGVASAPTESRPFRQTPDMPQIAILAACARGNLGELATIHRLAEYIAMREKTALPCPELHALPGAKIHSPGADARQDRLVAYRCAALTGLLASGEFHDKKDDAQAAHAEVIAHAMLAAEKEPSNAV